MSARLALDGVAIGYAERVLAADIDFALADASTTCLMGPNGVGKTTLFRTILGLLPPLRGRVRIAGRDVSALSRETVARHIAHVPQAFLGDPSHMVIDIVVMGRTARLGLFSTPGRDDYAAAHRALDALGIADLAGRSADRISGGQQQLMLIARALAQETEIIVMDEPTASLDLGNRLALLDHVRALASKGLSLLVSTHDPEHAFDIADRVAVMGRRGRFEVGTVDEIMTPGKLGDLYGLDLRIETTASGRRVVTRSAGAEQRNRSECDRDTAPGGRAASLSSGRPPNQETTPMAIHPLAVIVHPKGDGLEEVLAAVRDRLAARPGTRLGGVVPRLGPCHSNGRRSLWLDDIGRGDTIALSQDLGAGSTACILDPDGLANARVRLAEAIATRPDLVFFGRFANEELAGRGIREEIGLALAEDIPSLVAVEHSIVPGWTEFAGDEWTKLPLDADAIISWFTALQAERNAAAA